MMVFRPWHHVIVRTNYNTVLPIIQENKTVGIIKGFQRKTFVYFSGMYML